MLIVKISWLEIAFDRIISIEAWKEEKSKITKRKSEEKWEENIFKNINSQKKVASKNRIQLKVKARSGMIIVLGRSEKDVEEEKRIFVKENSKNK